MSKTTLTKINKVTLLQVKSKLLADKAPYVWNDESFLLELEGLEKRDAKDFRRRGRQSSLNNFDVKRLILYRLPTLKNSVQETIGITG